MDNILKTVSHKKANLYDLFYASKARKTYTNLGVALILLIVFLVFALVPTLQTLDTVQEKIETYEKLNSLVKTKINTAKVLNNQINLTSKESPTGLKDEIEFAQRSVLTHKDIDILYHNVYQRAKMNNVTLEYITTQFYDSKFTKDDTIQNAPSSSFYEVNFTASAYDQTSMINFIKSLEGYDNMPIISRIKDLSIADAEAVKKISDTQKDNEKDNEADNGKKYQISFTIIVYNIG